MPLNCVLHLRRAGTSSSFTTSYPTNEQANIPANSAKRSLAYSANKLTAKPPPTAMGQAILSPFLTVMDSIFSAVGLSQQ